MTEKGSANGFGLGEFTTNGLMAIVTMLGEEEDEGEDYITQE